MHHHLLFFLQTHRALGYIAVFVAMIFEGDLFLFTAAFLTHQGYFDPLNMFVTLVTGVMSGDLLWYWLGLRLNDSRRFTAWAKKLAQPFDDHLQHRTLHTIFLSKFIYGVHHAILIRAGMLRIRLDKFLKIDFFTSLVWIVIVGALGFISSFSFIRVRHSIKFVEAAILTAFLVFVGISYFISYEAKKKL